MIFHKILHRLPDRNADRQSFLDFAGVRYKEINRKQEQRPLYSGRENTGSCAEVTIKNNYIALNGVFEHLTDTEINS